MVITTGLEPKGNCKVRISEGKLWKISTGNIIVYSIET